MCGFNIAHLYKDAQGAMLATLNKYQRIFYLASPCRLYFTNIISKNVV